MRKRSKKRIPQDEKPWIRLINRSHEDINIFNKKTTHSFSGKCRLYQSTLFFNENLINSNKLIFSSLLKDTRTRLVESKASKLLGHIEKQNLFHKFYSNKNINLHQVKNFCLYLGKNRTYNRDLYISRQSIRKLMRTGLISGLQKV